MSALMETVSEGRDGVYWDDRSMSFCFEMTGCSRSVRDVADLVLPVDVVSRRSNKYLGG